MDESYKLIPLTKGRFAIVDTDDYDELSKYKWYVSPQGYAVRKPNKLIHMHRVVNKTPDGFMTDHVNSNRLDNRKRNLRACTQQENERNRSRDLFSSGKYKGVSSHQNTKKWRARITVNKKAKHLGFFDTQEEAALAYNKKAIELFGKFACLNIV